MRSQPTASKTSRDRCSAGLALGQADILAASLSRRRFSSRRQPRGVGARAKLAFNEQPSTILHYAVGSAVSDRDPTQREISPSRNSFFRAQNLSGRIPFRAKFESDARAARQQHRPERVTNVCW
jgi:hypothetical protein